MTYDVVVVGLGAMGSAAVYQLAKAGANVLGVDRFTPPHVEGSTHGDTRITRRATGEGNEYVPLVTRSQQIWREIEEQTGESLFTQCGAFILAPDQQPMHDSDDFIQSTVAAAQAFGIDHQLLDAADVAKRLPHFALSGSEQGYWEPGAGYLRPEHCVAAQLSLARRRGASVSVGEQVLGLDDDWTSVTVRTTERSVTAAKVVVTAGPWMSELVPDLADHLTVFRQVLYWFDLADSSQYEAYRDMPVYIWSTGRHRDDIIYGFPMIDGIDGGAKVAGEQFVDPTTPDDVQRTVTEQEIDTMYDEQVAGRLPGLSRRCLRAVTCLYTAASGSRFLIDTHPSMRNVIVASPCSGHGFKHSAAIGESLAQLAMSGRSELDLSAFRYPV